MRISFQYVSRDAQKLTVVFVHTFVNRQSNVVRNVVFSNINNVITCIHASIRSFIINYLVIKKVETGARATDFSQYLS